MDMCKEKFRMYSELGFHQDDRGDFCAGFGCHRFSWPVAACVLEDLSNPAQAASLADADIPLSRLVAICVTEYTGTEFSLGTLMKILEKSGEQKGGTALLKSYQETFQSAWLWISREDPHQETTKQAVRSMMKWVLWTEVYSFLRSQGHSELMLD